MTQSHTRAPSQKLPRIILSASRRTDIPAFYLPWFMQQLKKGYFDIQNPFNRQIRRVQALPDDIYAIVFWSKNYGPFLTSQTGQRLTQKGYKLYFNFTLNSESVVLEPGVPPLSARLEQMAQLAALSGPDKIAWRFDPICRFTNLGAPGEQDNLSDFSRIADTAARLGIKKCVTSFMDLYPKINKRLKYMAGTHDIHLVFQNFDLPQRQAIIKKLTGQLTARGITLHLCCEKDTCESLGPNTQVRPNACVDAHELFRLFGGDPPDMRRDYGQRSKQGCRCTRSVDVGSYQEHPCHHDCLYCYANPSNAFKPEFNPGNLGEQQ